MMKLERAIGYRVVLQEVMTEEGEPCHVYGLQGLRYEGEDCRVEEELLDITTDSVLAHQMADLFEKHQLSFSHLRDAVEDLLELA